MLLITSYHIIWSLQGMTEWHSLKYRQNEHTLDHTTWIMINEQSLLTGMPGTNTSCISHFTTTFDNLQRVT